MQFVKDLTTIPLEAMRQQAYELSGTTKGDMAFGGYVLYHPNREASSLERLTNTSSSETSAPFNFGVFITRPRSSEEFIPLIYHPEKNLTQRGTEKPFDFMVPDEQGDRLKGEAYLLGRFLIGDVKTGLGPLIYSVCNNCTFPGESDWDSQGLRPRYLRGSVRYETGIFDPELYYASNQDFLSRPRQAGVPLEDDLRRLRRFGKQSKGFAFPNI